MTPAVYLSRISHRSCRPLFWSFKFMRPKVTTTWLENRLIFNNTTTSIDCQLQPTTWCSSRSSKPSLGICQTCWQPSRNGILPNAKWTRKLPLWILTPLLRLPKFGSYLTPPLLLFLLHLLPSLRPCLYGFPSIRWFLLLGLLYSWGGTEKNSIK